MTATKAPTLEASSITKRLRRAGVGVSYARNLDRTYPLGADGYPVELVGRVLVEHAGDGAAEVLRSAGYVVVEADARYGYLAVTLADRAAALEAKVEGAGGHAYIARGGTRNDGTCALCAAVAGHSIHDAGILAALAEAARAALTATTAVELEAHPDDDAADLVNPAGPRVYLRGTVHLILDVPEVGEATCGVSTRGGIDTEAPVSCPACLTTEARIDRAVERTLEARRQAEAPASPALPGIDAAIVEADLGAGLAQVLPEVLVVVPCSGAKLDHAAPAGELYTGTLHKAARAAADAIVERTPGARVVILSALHGLLELDTVVAPYDVTIGDAILDAARPVDVAKDLARLGATRVVALTPGRYTELLRAACELVADVELETPLAGSRGIGEQRGRLRRIRTGELPLTA